MGDEGTVRVELEGVSHPDESALAALAERRLGGAERARLLEHLDGCARCREVVVALEGDGPLDDGVARTVTRDPLIGQRLGEYRVVEQMAQGGMGRVYLGEQPEIGKRVAIKVLLPVAASDPELVHRLQVEARAVASIRHPHIVDVYGFGALPDGRAYLVMELLEGQSLAELLHERGRLRPFEVLTVLEQTMGALAAAHALQVVHRDLKPGNLFCTVLPDGAWHLTVLDFGLAKHLDRDTLTSPDVVLGTPGYMAPEQIRAQGVTDRADVYAMGVVAWQLLSGSLPFEGNSAIEVMRKHLDEPLPPFPADLPVPVELQELLTRMLAKRSSDRPSAGAVAKELTSIRRGLERSPTLKVASVATERNRPAPGPEAGSKPLTVSLRPAASGGRAGATPRPPPTTGPRPRATLQPENEDPDTHRELRPAIRAHATDVEQPAVDSGTDRVRATTQAELERPTQPFLSRSRVLAAIAALGVAVAGLVVLVPGLRTPGAEPAVQSPGPIEPPPPPPPPPPVDEHGKAGVGGKDPATAVEHHDAPPVTVEPGHGPQRPRPPPPKPKALTRAEVEGELQAAGDHAAEKLAPAMRRIVGVQLSELKGQLQSGTPPAEVHANLEKLRAEYGLK